MIQVDWKGGMAFHAGLPSGHSLVLDSTEAHGGQNLGPSPVETLLASAAACSAMDVIAILRKKQQVVTAYRIELSHERAAEGEWPRPVLGLTIKHVVSGDGLDPDAVARAVELSDTKYCTVIATLRTGPKVTSLWEVE